MQLKPRIFRNKAKQWVLVIYRKSFRKEYYWDTWADAFECFLVLCLNEKRRWK
jgi:hypothetical protein